MPSFSVDNIENVDLAVYILGLIAYIILVWVPVSFSLYVVHTFEGLEWKWRFWKFHRQYIYIEIWFRSHVILGGSAIIAMITEEEEAGFDALFIIIATLIYILIVCLLKYSSMQVKQRIPGTEQITEIINKRVKGTNTSRGDMQKFMSQISSHQRVNEDTHTQTHTNDNYQHNHHNYTNEHSKDNTHHDNNNNNNNNNNIKNTNDTHH